MLLNWIRRGGTGFIAQAEASIRSTKAALNLEEGSVDISVELLSAKAAKAY